MKRSIKLVVCMLLIATIALPSVFATGLGTSSSIVKVGTVDTTDVNYNVDIEWGSLVYNFIKSENGEYYVWEAEEEFVSDRVTITNNSNVIVNADVKFTSAIANVNGFKNEDASGLVGRAYALLSEKPEDFETGEYYEMDEDRNFVLINVNTEFEADRYYEMAGLGGGPSENPCDIPAISYEGTEIWVSAYEWVLTLEGGSLSDVRPGATIGAVTVTLS